MKIQLDTQNKTITIEEDVNLHDFYEQLNGLLPGGIWREYTLKVTKITEWKDPITIPDPWIQQPWQQQPWSNPYPTTNPYDNIIYTTSTNKTIYNFEIK